MEPAASDAKRRTCFMRALQVDGRLADRRWSRKEVQGSSRIGRLGAEGSLRPSGRAPGTQDLRSLPASRIGPLAHDAMLPKTLLAGYGSPRRRASGDVGRSGDEVGAVAAGNRTPRGGVPRRPWTAGLRGPAGL